MQCFWQCTKFQLMLNPQLAFLFGTSRQVDKALNSYLFIFFSTSITLAFADNTAEDGTFSQWDQESLVST